MTAAITISALAGTALGLYFAWPALIWATPATLFSVGAIEIANGSPAALALLSLILNVTALQAGYLVGALVHHNSLSPEFKTAKETGPTMRSGS